MDSREWAKFQIFLYSHGYFRSEFISNCNSSLSKILKDKLIYPIIPRTDIRLRWVKDSTIPNELSNLQLKKYLDLVNSFQCIESVEKDLKFIEEVKRDGSAREPIWGDNGHTLSPSLLLLPLWERLKVENITTYKLLESTQEFPTYDNNKTCILKNGTIITAEENRILIGCFNERGDSLLFVESLDNIYDIFKIHIHVSDQEPRIDYDDMFPDFTIHFMKKSKLYGKDVLCVCTESGDVFIFDINQFITNSCSVDHNNIDSGENSNAIPQPLFILKVLESCWSIDIFDSDPNIKVIAVGSNDHKITIFYNLKGWETFLTSSIPLSHNIPCVSFIDGSAYDDCIFLSFASISGITGIIEINKILGPDKNNPIQWKFLDIQQFPEWCWTITPVKKHDFRHVSNYEFLSNNYDTSVKDFELKNIIQDSLVLDQFPNNISLYGSLGIGACFAQTHIPVASLDLLNGIKYSNKKLKLKLRFTTIGKNHSSLGPNVGIIKREYVCYDEEKNCSYFLLNDELPLGDDKFELKDYPLVSEAHNLYRDCKKEAPESYKIQSNDMLSKFQNSWTNFNYCNYMLETDGLVKFSSDQFNRNQGHMHILQTLHGSSTSECFKLGDVYSQSFNICISDHRNHLTISSKCDLKQLYSFYNQKLDSIDTYIFEQELNKAKNDFYLFRSWAIYFGDYDGASDNEYWGTDALDRVNSMKRIDDIDLVILKCLEAFKDTNSANIFLENLLNKEIKVNHVMREAKSQWLLTDYIEKIYSLLIEFNRVLKTNIGNTRSKFYIGSEDMFMVTTNNRIYLLYGNPLIINAFTEYDIFPTDNIFGCTVKQIKNLNRISIVCFIRELQCMVVASQCGLISLLRLTEFHGIYSFRQEYVFGWEHIEKNERNKKCMKSIIGVNDNSFICNECDSIFPYYGISGMDYMYKPADLLNSQPAKVILYVTHREYVTKFYISE